MAEMPIWWSWAAVIGIDFGFAGMVGAVLTLRWLPVAHSGVRRFGLCAWALTAVASVASLCIEAASMAELPLSQAFQAVPQMLTETHFGQVWIAGILALLVSFLLFARGAGWLGLAGLAGFAAARAAIGHAGGDGDASVRVIIDCLHLLAGAVWSGTVFVSSWLVLARLEQASAFQAYAKSLSRWASAALALIALSGVFNAWTPFGHGWSQVAPEYWQLLLGKLALVLVAVGMGAYNRFICMPALTDADAMRLRFRRILQAESLVLMGAMALAAVLSCTAA